jgi:hypothetical protein
LIGIGGSLYLAEITEKLIREEVYGETREAEEVDEPRRLGPMRSRVRHAL